MKNRILIGFLIMVVVTFVGMWIIKVVNRNAKFEACVQEAYIGYVDNWDRMCEILGREPDCLLPPNQVEHLDDQYDGNLDLCFRRFD